MVTRRKATWLAGITAFAAFSSASSARADWVSDGNVTPLADFVATVDAFSNETCKTPSGNLATESYVAHWQTQAVQADKLKDTLLAKLAKATEGATRAKLRSDLERTDNLRAKLKERMRGLRLCVFRHEIK